MFRSLLAFILVAFLGSMTVAALAQVPVQTPEVSFATPTLELIPTLPGTVIPAEPVAPTPEPPISPIPPEALSVLISARSDLELLANDRLGATRPEGWSGSLDINDVQLPILIRLDLELLTGALLGANSRPQGWFGAVPSTPYAIARDIRHDLELLADAVIQPGVRPPGWAGDDPLMRCDRATQNLVSLLQRGGVFTLTADPGSATYCAQAELEASRFTEANLLNVASSGGGGIALTSPGSSASVAPPGSVSIENDLAWAFLDRFATRRVGLIPRGTIVSPVARSYTQFSRMILVRGENFEVLIDYRNTSLSGEQFQVLPNINDTVSNTVCNAVWCQPVVITSGAPVNSGGGRAGGPGGRRQVNMAHIIIYYDGPDQNESVVVRMMLCPEPTRGNTGNCQPVTEVVQPNGTRLRSVGTLSGMRQYRLPYGYSTTSVRTRNYYTVDLWISRPGQR